MSVCAREILAKKGGSQSDSELEMDDWIDIEYSHLVQKGKEKKKNRGKGGGEKSRIGKGHD